MSRIWGDVYDAAGTLLGPGPLTNIKSASITRVLDGPGEISLEVPLADPRVQDLITNERRIKLWTADPGILAGATDASTPPDVSTWDDNVSFPATNTIDGDDETLWMPDGASSADWAVAYGPASGQTITVNGYRLTFPVGGDPDRSMKTWTVYKLSELLEEDLLIETREDEASWTEGESRDFLFSSPITLVPTGEEGTENLKFVFALQQTGAVAPQLAEFEWLITGSDIPTATPREVGIGIVRQIKGSNTAAMQTLSGPDQLDELRRKNTLLARKYDGTLCADVADALIALVSGWSATTTGTPENGLFARFDGASVLKGLQEIAKQQGLHFRWESDKHIHFGPLGDAASLRVIQAGHRLMRGLELNDDVALIDTLTWVDDSEAVANWIVPVGGGQGEAALTLQHSTRGVDRVDWITGYSDSYRDSYQTLQGPGVQNGEKIAMQFTLSASSYIKSALLLLRKYGSPTGTLTIRIETDSSDEPSGTLADANLTTTKAEADLSATGWVMEPVTFATGATLAAGTYWMVLSTSRSYSATNYVRWGTDRSSPAYTGGQVKRYNDSAWEEPGNVRDACFAIRTLTESRTTNVIAEYDETHLDKWVALQRTVITIGGEITYTPFSVTQSTTLDINHTFSKCFDNNNATFWSTSSGNTTGYGTITFSSGNKTIGKYAIRATTTPAQCASAWVLEAWNGSGYDTIDSQSGQTGWTSGEVRTFTLETPATSNLFRLTVSANDGDANYLAIAELDLYGATIASKTYLAQSFVGDGGRVAEIGLWLTKHGSPTGDLSLKIEGDSGGNPDGSPITNGMSNLVVASTLTINPERYAFTFNTPPTCADSTTYWVVLETTDSASEDNFVLWGADASSPSYADGEMKSYDGASWAAENKDACFDALAYCFVEPYAIQTTTGPDGRTLYYLSDADSITACGQIEKVFTADITPLSMSATDLENAANALYDAAAAWLERYAVVQSTYSCTLRKAYANLKPGQLIRVTYNGLVYDLDGNAVTWRAVDDEFWIIRVTENLAAGTTRLEISNVDRAKEDISALIVGTMEAVSLRNVQVQSYPAIWSFFSQDTVQAAVTWARGEGFGDTVLSKAARFNIPIPGLMLNISKAIIHLQTRPLGSTTLAEDVDGTNGEYNVFFGSIEDSQYPAGLSLAIDGIDVSSALGGPWLANNENEALDIELDITDYLSDEGLPRYGNHELSVTCDYRDIGNGNYEDYAVPGFEPWPLLAGGFEENIPTHGVVMANVSIHCTTQAVKT